MGRRLSSAIVAALAGALTFPASAPAQPSLRASDLTVEVEAEPFAIVFRDRGDGDVLRTSQSGLEPTDTVARYGPPGYAFDRRVPVVDNAYFGYYVPAEAPTLWFHARRLRALCSRATATSDRRPSPAGSRACRSGRRRCRARRGRGRPRR